jgi:outer membrane autotransporter protein
MTGKRVRATLKKKALPGFVFAFCLMISSAVPALAGDLRPDYGESVALAVEHAANPAGWLAPSLVVIPDGGAGGLTYDGTDLVVRTVTKSGYFTSQYVGQPGYAIYGDPRKDATWVTTGNDATRFLTANGATGENVVKLLERGLGMNATGTHDAVVEFTVTPTNEYLMRPTRNPDITQYLPASYGTNLPFARPAGMSDAAWDNFTAYYDNWMSQAYSSDPNRMFPWTQLGYTFFWGNGYDPADIEGMSEFILPGGTAVGIYGIYATGSYIYTRNDGSAFSSADTAQFGNGFAGFRIDGTCDTVWAGHRFQKKTSSDTGDGHRNRIEIENTGSVSGGQGLLVWSLNYDVDNRGFVGGATSRKFGIEGTENVAVLFMGDTSTRYGTPVTAGCNRLVNSGTISSPGTAVRADGGDTLIVNNAGGVISGGSWAVRTAAGDDTVTVNGGEIAGNIDLGAGSDTLEVTGAGGGALLTFPLDRNTASSARVLDAETVTIADGTGIAADVTGTENLRNDDRFLIVDAVTLTVDPGTLAIRDDGSLPMIRFSAGTEGNRLYLLASRDGGWYRRNSGNPSLGTVLDLLAESATGDFAAVMGDLDRSGSAANGRRLEPDADRGTLEAAYGKDALFTGTLINRMDEIRSGAAGGAGNGPWGAWTRGFGGCLNQGARGSSEGYKGDLLGVSLGFDRLLSDRFLVGLSGGFARSRIRPDDGRTRTDGNSWQAGLYGNFARDAFSLSAVLSCAGNRYEASRHILFGTTDRVAESRYGGHQVAGSLEGGYTFGSGGFDIMPLVSLRYMRLHLDGYSETGAGSLNLTVEAQDYDMLQSGLGVKLSRPLLHGDARVLPEVHLKWLYDFIGDRQQATSTFTGTGASFATEGFDPPQSSINAGATLTVAARSGLTLSLNYEFEAKEDFRSHTGLIAVRYAF